MADSSLAAGAAGHSAAGEASNQGNSAQGTSTFRHSPQQIPNHTAQHGFSKLVLPPILHRLR